ncbi:amino acid ABC transporter permease [Pelagibacterium sp. H642]|uniref:amino acid ABC transporter permease n=1 Tax=Pelagibacterium sp. H642 TaxID=1881069 RepID=UPI002814C8ED|nr:amino acid ABC transporter permease [Pelagibacterium sp. H642]WMT90412.1 amino acid ABC transporter permease [Pelagibacterium sp. H642]
MNYVFDYGWVIPYAPMLLAGVLVTIGLSLLGTLGGIALGLGCAWTLSWGPGRARPVVHAYVEVIRNTPFLIQLFFIYFGLPELGIRVSAFTAAIATTVLNVGAYSCEIVRAGIQATPRGQVEAGTSLAMSRTEVFRHIILFPALERIWPALSSQFVIVMLGTSVVSQIAVEDITFVANFIQSRNFRSFETFFVSLFIYLALAAIMRGLLDLLGRRIFPRRYARD